ncbi:MAG: hypothetical protein ACFFD1_02385 [Candidatus Thorarchaeota archaeon]
MFIAICLFTIPKSLEPLNSFLPTIPIAGVSLAEKSVQTAIYLGCDKLFFFGINLNNLGFDIKKYESSILINILNELSEIDSITFDQIVLFTGETVFSEEILKEIKTTITSQKEELIIFTNKKEVPLPNFHPIILKIKTNSKSLSFMNNSGIVTEVSDPYFSLLYSTKSIQKFNLTEFGRFLITFYNKSTTFNLLKSINPVIKQFMGFFPFIIRFPWHFLDIQEKLMVNLQENIQGIVESGASIRNNVVIESGATILNGVYIKGPVYIASGASIGPNCLLRANTYIGPNVHIGQSVEIKNSIIMNGTQIGHLTYIGDSMIGPKNNYGAGSKTANLAFHDNPISMRILNVKISTNRRKMGIVTGEKVKTGINSSLMPGIKIFNNAIVGAHVLLQEDLDEHFICYYDKTSSLTKKKHFYY